VSGERLTVVVPGTHCETEFCWVCLRKYDFVGRELAEQVLEEIAHEEECLPRA
jgi:hypothetical protein